MPTGSTSPEALAPPVSAAAAALTRAARAALALAAFTLPFELSAPLARVGPLQLSSVEAALYAALALSAAAITAGVLPGWRRLSFRDIARRHAGVALFALVLVLSAARAPLAQNEAIKFALRNIGGIALYVAAANLLRAPAAALTVMLAMSIGAAVAAILMWAELYVPGAPAALRPFHTGSFDVFGLPRAAGPFQYPNIAAMYLEAALPVTLMAGVALDLRRAAPARAVTGERAGKRAGTLAATLAALAIIWALSLTASRAALLTAGVVLAGLAVHGLRRRTPGRWQAPALLALLGLLAVGQTAGGTLSGLRLAFWKDDVWYRSAIVPVAPPPGLLAPKQEATFDVDVRNAGARPWPAAGPSPIKLSYHWRDDASGKLAVYDGVRSVLPHDVPAGATVRMPARVRAPDRPGRYRLHLEMVHEDTTWFGEQGDTGYDAIVDVQPQLGPAGARPARFAAALVPAASAAPLEHVTRTMLWRAAVSAWRDHPLLGLGPDNFRRAYNRYVGLAKPDERLHANNLYFETLASLGLAGIAALALLVFGLARAARAAVRVHGAASPGGLVAAGAAAGLGAYLVHGFFDYFLEFTPTYALFWLLAGLLTGLSIGRERDRDRAPVVAGR
ncbi:MAG TPA: O-antigen ligase family protein [Polyangia bacterium]